MAEVRVIFIGAQRSGKTKFINRLCSNTYHPNYEGTIGIDLLIMRKDQNKIKIWDTSGSDRFAFIIDSYYPQAEVGAFFIDLSNNDNETDIETIKGRIQQFHSVAPNAKIILVGTKKDAAVVNFDDILERIQSTNIPVDSHFITSAQNDDGINDFKDELFTLAKLEQTKTEEQSLPDLPLTVNYTDVKEAFTQSLAVLPTYKKTAIIEALQHLETNIASDPGATVTFIDTCERILEGKHPHLMNTILTLAAIAVVTAITGLIGFGIGFAAGLWTGPGAFISGIMAGNAVACSVVAASTAAGLSAGGLTFFHHDKTTNDVIENVYKVTGSLLSEHYSPTFK